MAYLTCTALSVGYAGTPVARDISFSVGAGDALFVVGENGAGKTTLLKTILGLQPPLAGDVAFGDGAGAGEVGYLPQKGESQRDFPASVWEVALSGRASRLGKRPFYSRADKSAAAEALHRVGACELRDMPFGSISGGQQQRVLLARALASYPKLLVLDEPTTGLDPEAAESLYRTIDELRASGVGVLAVTHDVAAALPHATQVLEVRDKTAKLHPASAWVTEGSAV
ncbi:metal ABC transporter ATP-binding protein [Slackia heliotrinireducens]|uniref:metal ABC transporter ATP-binding protein n=1 Tax=Slackia heliotrinireducens TaxID=84110 RepID=UPI003315CAE4